METLQGLISRSVEESDKRIKPNWWLEQEPCEYCIQKNSKTCDYCAYKKRKVLLVY